MDPSSAQHHEEMGSQTLESMLVSTKAQQEKKPRPPEQALKCPRCESSNTKFCYYNNYSLTQPRYFCKSCRRYWTKGGTLRNVPVGGGCRKNKRSSSSSSSKRTQDQSLITTNPSPLISSLTPLSYDSTDLSLAFARLQKQTNGYLGYDEMLGNPNNSHCDVLGNPSSVNTCAATSHCHGFLDALRGGFIETPNGFHNAYYGIGNGDHMGGMGVNVSEEMAMVYHDDHMSRGDMTVTAMKHESFNGRETENRVLLGFPWQVGGDGNMGEVDSGRQSWNGIGSSWHGLLNSPLM